MKFSRSSFALLALLSITLGVPRAQSQDEDIPRFRADVRTVLVDVLVLDEDGTPVADLGPGDFEVYEDGVEQQVTHVDRVDWTSYVGSLDDPSAASDEVNVFPRRFIFVLNRPNASFGTLNRAKNALETFVVESMADGDEAMIIDIGNNATRIQEFQPSKENTLRAIRGIVPMELRNFNVEQSSRTLYDALKELGEELQAVRGRKVVLLMSMEIYAVGGPGTGQMTSELRQAVEALNQSNTSVYAIDIAQGARASNGGLFPLSDQTGGRHFRNRQRYERAVRRIGKENQRFYLLTYRPSDEALDGAYRSIDVRVARPDVEVIARNGYFAREGPGSRAVEVRAEPSGSAGQPHSVERPAAGGREPESVAVDVGPGLEITAYLFPTGEETLNVPVAIDVPRDLLSEGPLTLRTAVLKDGELVAEEESTVDRDHSHRIEQFALLPGSYLLEVRVRSGDRVLQQSSIQIDLPTGFGQRFGFSSVALALSPEDEPPSNPEALPLRPTTSLTQGEDAFLFFRLIPGAGDERTEAARLRYRIYRREEKLYEGEHPRTIELGGSDPAGFPVLLKIPMSRYGPGLYRVELTATDDRRGRRAFGEIELLIRQAGP